MLQQILFISEQFLKDRLPINDNVDEFTLTSSIRKAQDIEIAHIIGSKLINKISQQIEDDNLQQPYKDLLEQYIVPCLTEYALYRALPFMHYSLSRKGVGTFSDEFTQPVEDNQVEKLRYIFKNDGDYYAERLRTHLIDNQTLYPEYTAETEGSEVSPDKSANYSTGLYIEKANYRGRYPYPGSRTPDWY